MMAALVALQIATHFAAAGGVVVRDVPIRSGFRAQVSVENPEQNWMEFKVPVSWAFLSDLVPRRVMRVVTPTSAPFEEWRINKIAKATLGGDGMVTVGCIPPIYALAECGLYYTTGAGGVRDYSYAESDETLTEVLTALLLGTPDLPSWIDLGTIDPTVHIDVAGEDAAPLAVLLQGRDAVRAKGIMAEVAFRMDGETGYLVDVVTQLGASATVPEFRARKNLRSYVYTSDCARQTTRIEPRGPTDATGVKARLSRARFPVSAVNGGTKRVTVYDEDGGAGPIAFDEQYVGQFTFREKTGRTFVIVHSYKATQELELQDVSDIAAHTVTAPEWLSFRESDALTGTRRVGSADTHSTGHNIFYQFFDVSSVDGGTKKLTVVDNFGEVDPVVADGQHVDWIARRMSLVLETTVSGMASLVLSCGSVTGVQAGDVCALTTSAAPNYNYFNNGALVVDTVNAGPITLNVHARDAGGDVTNFSGAFRVRIYRPVATTHLIRASSASANTITVDAVGTAAATDIVEFLQPCQGVLPTWLEDPTSRALYSVKISVLPSIFRGECNLTPNGCQTTWPGGGSSLPDAWTQASVSGSPVITKITDPALYRMGLGSLYAEFRNAGGTATQIIQAPPSYVHPIEGAEAASVRLKLMFPGASWTGDISVTVRLVTVDAAGTITTGVLLPSNPSVTMYPPTHSTAPANLKKAADTWIDVAISAQDISRVVNERLMVTVEGAGASVVAAYIDGVQITQTSAAPGAEPELLVAFSDAVKLLQAANVELVANAAPPVEFTMQALDFFAQDPVLYAEDQTTLGGTVRAQDPDQALDLQLRLLSKVIDYDAPPLTELTLSVLPPRFTSVTAAQRQKQLAAANALRPLAESIAAVATAAAAVSAATPGTAARDNAQAALNDENIAMGIQVAGAIDASIAAST